MNNLISLELWHFFFWMALAGFVCFFLGLILGAEEAYRRIRESVKKILKEAKND